MPVNLASPSAEQTSQRRSDANARQDGNPVSFTNPLYADPGDAGADRPAGGEYADVPAAADTYGADESGYMDVSGGYHGQRDDVPPHYVDISTVDATC